MTNTLAVEAGRLFEPVGRVCAGAGTNRPCVRNRKRSPVTRAESDMTCAVRMSLIHKIILHDKKLPTIT